MKRGYAVILLTTPKFLDAEHHATHQSVTIKYMIP